MSHFQLSSFVSVFALWGACLLAPAHAETPEADGSTLVLVTKIRDTPYLSYDGTSATRTGTEAINVPQALTLITRDQMEDQNIQSMAEAVRYVPGIGANAGEGNRDALVFRGNGSTADLFVDGLRDDVQYYRDLYNIEQIEAIKGPNAMMFGRGSPGGLLNRVTKRADGVAHKAMSLSLGDYQKARLSADFGTALRPDTHLRANMVFEDSKSFRDGYYLKRYGLNPTMGFVLNEKTRWDIGLEGFHDERTSDRGIPGQAGTTAPLSTPPGAFFGDPDKSDNHADVLAAQSHLSTRLSNGIIIHNRNRIAHYDKFYQNIYASEAATTRVAIGAYNHATVRTNLFHQTDLIYAFETGQIGHTLMGGVELGAQWTDNVRQSGIFDLSAGVCQSGSTAVKCYVSSDAAHINAPVTFTSSATDALNHGVNRYGALYIQDEMILSSHWRAVVGVRFDQFDTKLHDDRPTATAAEKRLKARSTNGSPRLGLIYKPTKTASLYLSYGVTFLPRSGEQLAALTLANEALEPESFENIELGAKFKLNARLSLEAAAYRLTKSNTAVVNPEDITRLVLMSGVSQRTDGFEISLSGRLNKYWDVIGAYAYQDGTSLKEVKTSASRIIAKGSKSALTPQHTFSLWNRYRVSARLCFGLGLIYQDKSYASTSNSVILPAFTRVDGAIYYTLNEKAILQLNIENMGDARYYPTATSDNNIMIGAPRTVTLSLKLKL